MESNPQLDTEYLPALDWARKVGISKSWAVKLADQGRLQGAYKAGLVWLIPAGCVVPPKARPGPQAKPDSAAARQAMERVQRRQATAMERKAEAIQRVMRSPDEQREALLAKLSPRERHVYLQQERGCRQTGEAWEFDGSWVGPVWMPDMTKEQFDDRREEFMDAAEAIERGDDGAQWPSWIPK